MVLGLVAISTCAPGVAVSVTDFERETFGPALAASYMPESIAITSPPALVFGKAALKLLHGRSKEPQSVLSAPCAETKVRSDWACASVTRVSVAKKVPM